MKKKVELKRWIAYCHEEDDFSHDWYDSKEDCENHIYDDNWTVYQMNCVVEINVPEPVATITPSRMIELLDRHTGIGAEDRENLMEELFGRRSEETSNR